MLDPDTTEIAIAFSLSSMIVDIAGLFENFFQGCWLKNELFWTRIRRVVAYGRLQDIWGVVKFGQGVQWKYGVRL